MKKLISCLLISLYLLTSFGQKKTKNAPYSYNSNQPKVLTSNPSYNSWINFSSNQALSDQQYYKIQITKEGIYHINYSDLSAANIPVNAIPSNKYQIFHNGKEQPLYIPNPANTNSPLSPGSYIEFFGQGNDGQLDSALYVDDNTSTPNVIAQPNIRYSLFTDTAIYFLTWIPNLKSDTGSRMLIQNNIDFSIHTPIPYFQREIFKQYTDDYNYGTADIYDSFDPDYTTGEGFCSARFFAGNSLAFNFSVPNLYTGFNSPNSIISTAVAGRSKFPTTNPNQRTRVLFNSQTLIDTMYNGYTLFHWNFSIPNSNITSNNTIDVNSVNLGQNGNDQSNSVFYYSFLYPHTLDFTGEGNPSAYKIFLSNTTDTVFYLKFTKFDTTNTVVLYDITNGRRASLINTSTALNGLVPRDNGNKTCFISSINNIQNILGIKPVSLSNNAQFINYNYLATNQKTDSAFIIITHNSLMASTMDYANYRKTMGHHPVVIDIDELYNQFAWGIQKHPLSIRNFAAFALANWKSPQNLFLIGKAIFPIYARTDATMFAKTLVPSFGYPPCDNLFTSRLINYSIYDPAIPTGRLSAQTPTDVENYKTKVDQYEHNIVADWMKQVLHFGGGNPGTQANDIMYFLNDYKDTIVGPSFGGHVTTYSKSSNQIIQINQSDSLQNQINQGVSIMTFFGHASGPTAFDISTNDPSTFNNAPYYHFIIGNSCSVGDMYQPVANYSERCVMDVNTNGQIAGAIAFLASVTLGIEYNMFIYTDRLYQEISSINYGNSIGKCIKATIDSTFAIYGSDIGMKEVCLEMTLHGDPSIVINSPKLPDLVMNPQNVYFSPFPVTSDMTNFNMSVICTNIGKAINNDTFNIQVKRTYPTGIDSIYNISVPSCYYKDTFTFSLPVDQFNGVGLNTFSVFLDSKYHINESNETNNSTRVTLFVQSADINPVYPTNYAIVPRKDSLILKACTSNPFSPSRTYDFQIDTTDAYNSPMKRTYQITQSGGVVSWANPYPYLKDSTVYYWRVSPHAIVDSLFKWREFSFEYIPGKTGWSQAHIFQFKNDYDTTVVYNKSQRKWDFATNVSSIQCTDILTPINNIPGYTLNNTGGDYGACGRTGFFLVVLDSTSLEPWTNADHNLSAVNLYNPPSQFGPCARNGRPENWFIFDSNDPSSMVEFSNALNTIPNGDYFAIMSMQELVYHSLPLNLKLQIYNLGGIHITTVQTGQVYMLFNQKGHPIDSAKEAMSSHPGDTNPVYLNATLYGKWFNGTINSTIIGPASRWTSLHWQEHSVEPSFISKDSVFLRILGIDSTGKLAAVLRNHIPVYTTDTSLSWINASQYPFLQLQVYLEDSLLRSPPQMNRWQIYYDGVPDVALNPSKGWSFYKDPLNGGDTLKFSSCIENISNYPMPDSLHVNFYVYDQNRIRHNLPSQTKKKLAVGDTTMASVWYDSTQTFAGLNSLWIEANPLNKPVEQYHFNNLGEIDFKVNKDVTNPILDVTFDGVHILNNDIVSSKPQILIKLKDENKYLALNDTSLFQVNMIDPSGHRTHLFFENNSSVPLDHSKMGWTPAQMPDNSFKIVYNPLLQDGTYTLDVQAIDRSHNYSGANDYRISFEVISHESISEVMNYPNPFSTSTRFVFTLTGSDIPTYFKIQIMTVTGHVVREIMLDQLGPIHIGRNITQYAWNGKDEYGDQLANGVYFYRIVTRLNGQMIDPLATGADQCISHGMGKMYLMR